MTSMLRLEVEQDMSGGGAFIASAARRRPPTKIDLRTTVQNQVIPRLREALESSLAQPRHPLVATGGGSSGDAIVTLADKLLADDFTSACDLIDARRSTGQSLESIYLHVLAPAACHLHHLLCEDLCNLADATVAFCNLQSLLRHYAHEFYGESAARETGFRALLVAPSQDGVDVALPVFGLLLLSEFFRRAGWNAWTERSLSSGYFRDTVLSGWFDLVEMLATSDRDLDEIASAIRTIRRGSPNSGVGVIVCGEVFRQHPEFVRLVGADLMASDPLTSLAQANQFVIRPTRRQRLS